jgi:zinc metalloprotease ZmpB
MPFELTDNVHVAEDDQGNIRHLEHFLRPFVASNTVAADSRQAAALEATDAPSTVALTPQALAQQYLQEVAPVYQFDPNMLPESGGAEARLAEPAAGKLELTEENELMGTTTISYQQT